MRNLLSLPFSSGSLWLFGSTLLGGYLLLHPALHHPWSYATALGGGLLLALLRPLGEGDLERMGRVWWLALLFAFASAFWSLSPGFTLRSGGFLAMGSLLYLMARSLGVGERTRLASLGFFLAAGASLLALHQYLFGFQTMEKSLLPNTAPEDLGVAMAAVLNQRATGPLLTPGALGALMIFFIPYGVVQIFAQRGSKRTLYGIGTLLLAGALLASQSVGALLCLSVSGLLVLGARRSFRWTLAVLGVGGLAFLLVLALRREDWVLSALSGRLGLWRTAWDLFLAHPLLGTGLGSFEEAYRSSGADLGTGSRFAHNFPLQLLVETGLVGTALFAAALVRMALRFQVPSRWEGWGVMTGALAVLLFCFLDLPLQMPELVWVFAGVLGVLELKPERPLQVPALTPGVLIATLLAVFLVAGFWPPFRPWNFALLAVALWGLLGYLRGSVERLPLWVALGSAFLGWKAFTSPSALGGVRFLETVGLVLCFVLILRALPAKEDLFKKFLYLGLVWGAGAWVFSFLGKPFEAWTGFPNPKHLAVFLVPLALLHLPGKGNGWKANLIFAASLATLVKLRATAALLGLLVGSLLHPKITRTWKVLLLVSLAGGAWWVHSHQATSTQWDRLLIWKAAVQVWTQSLWLGMGPGTFAGEFHRVKEPRDAELGRYLMDARFAHNEPLEFLVSFGLLGTFFLVALLWVLLQRTKGNRPAQAGLGTASLLDFSLHAPLNALQAGGLLTEPSKAKNPRSLAGAALAGTVALGLFGSVCFAPSLLREASRAKEANDLRGALRSLEKAERLNPWDARYAAAKAEYLEELHLATEDPIWRRKSDEAFERVLELERSNGQWALRKAQRWTGRAGSFSGNSPEFGRAEEAWAEAEKAMPKNAFLFYERGLFHLSWVKQKIGGLVPYRAAQADFQKAVELEPSFAAAWGRLAFCERQLGRGDKAREAMAHALEVHEKWKGKPGLGPVEAELTALSPEMKTYLLKGISQ